VEYFVACVINIGAPKSNRLPLMSVDPGHAGKVLTKHSFSLYWLWAGDDGKYIVFSGF